MILFIRVEKISRHYFQVGMKMMNFINGNSTMLSVVDFPSG